MSVSLTYIFTPLESDIHFTINFYLHSNKYPFILAQFPLTSKKGHVKFFPSPFGNVLLSLYPNHEIYSFYHFIPFYIISDVQQLLLNAC